MKQFTFAGDFTLYQNFRNHAIEEGLWYMEDGTLADWEVAFKGLGFNSYYESDDWHGLSDEEYMFFILKYS